MKLHECYFTWARIPSREPHARPLPSFPDLVFAVPWWGTGCQRVDQTMRGRGHLVDREVERRFVRARRTIGTAQLPDELKSGRADLVLGRRRGKISQDLDIPAHTRAPSQPVLARARGSRRLTTLRKRQPGDP